MRMLPLVLLAALSLALAMSLFYHHDDAPSSPLIGTAVTPFDLPMLTGSGRFTPASWKGEVALLTVFASWCAPCASEQPVLLRIARTSKAALYGLAWKDNAANVGHWLAQHGNPYHAVGIDPQGSATVALGLTGVPETFILDRHGRIVYDYRLPLTDEAADTVIVPLLEKLRHEN